MAASPSLALLWLMNSRISSVMDRVGGGLRCTSSSSSSSSWLQHDRREKRHGNTIKCNVKTKSKHFTLTFGLVFWDVIHSRPALNHSVYCTFLLQLNTILSWSVCSSWMRWFPSGLSASTSMTDDASVLLLPAEARLPARHSSPSLSACCRNRTAHMQNLLHVWIFQPKSPTPQSKFEGTFFQVTGGQNMSWWLQRAGNKWPSQCPV